MKKPKILIADDDRSITEGLGAILSDEGYEIEVALDGQKAIDRLASDAFGVALADLMMPKLDGLTLLKEIQARDITTECIIITGQATVDSAVQAMRQGAYDYIEKPLNAEKLNRLKALIPKALDKFNVRQKNKELASTIEGLTHYGELTGQSEAMRSVYRIIDAVAPSSASVLILGESGTGKELVARAIHNKSERAKGPIFALNCAALPKDILENELFGHEKGAFTGSTNEKAGAFEMAHGGTIFLDEVAEMAPDIQVKLLRALESRSIRRLGGKREISVDIRVVAATNKNLQKAIADGELREDLYYRLAVVEIYLPPLRERLGDVKLLANEFLARYAQQNGKKVTGFDNDAWSWILNYRWPGNVRELKNAVERAVIMTAGPTIGVADIAPRHLRPGADAGETSYGSVSGPPRRRASDKVAQGVDGNGSATVLGMTRDELFEAFARFVREQGTVGTSGTAAVGAAASPAVDGPTAEPEEPPARGKASRDHAPGKDQAKAKAKKR
ncbi:MAG TPA: sigma-54 dependent transcriptional regulator [Gemmatimonadaceae bacterium]|jgi:DNA-binding NtrC family response regulator|nr:sigma-54 dependent transcriptional regulator [Gemmatimonadaceae bacterium]